MVLNQGNASVQYINVLGLTLSNGIKTLPTLFIHALLPFFLHHDQDIFFL